MRVCYALAPPVRQGNKKPELGRHKCAGQITFHAADQCRNKPTGPTPFKPGMAN